MIESGLIILVLVIGAIYLIRRKKSGGTGGSFPRDPGDSQQMK
jgi:hypothetical protein